jgi:hypothetical protein
VSQVIAFSPNAASLALGAPATAAAASVVPGLGALNLKDVAGGPGASAAAQAAAAGQQQMSQNQLLVSALNARVAKVGGCLVLLRAFFQGQMPASS